MPPQVQTVRRVSLTGEVVETTQPIAPPTVMGGQAGPYAGAPGQAYSQQAGLAGPGATQRQVLPPGAYSPAAIMEQIGTEGPSLGERWEKGLAIALPIVALSMLIVHLAPAALLGVVFGNLLILPMVLGATGAIPRYEDAIVDCSIMLVVAVLLGPAIALGVYILTAMVKQECNGAIVAILLINILLKGLFAIAFAPAVDTLSIAVMYGFLNWMSFFGVCLSFLGWLLSSFFRGIGE